MGRWFLVIDVRRPLNGARDLGTVVVVVASREAHESEVGLIYLVSMRRHVHLALTACLGPLVVSAQIENSNWYFGQGCGMHFSGLATPVFQGSSPILANEGTATMSDGGGNLLYYTDGITVWNANHVPMLNGTGLLGGVSTTQSSLCVRKPGSTLLHYVFTLDHGAGVNGLRYSIIDMSLDGGLGGVTADKNILLQTPVTEKIAGCPHENGIDRWIVVHPWNSATFDAYLLTSAGLNTVPVVSTVGATHSGLMLNSFGQMKISPNGDKLALVTFFMNTTQLFSFDNSTGIVSAPIDLPAVSGEYGLSFSPHGTKLYTSTSDNAPVNVLLQYDITSNDPALIAASQFEVYQSSEEFGHLELGLDGKVYAARYNVSHLGVINAPNEAGALCDYVHEGYWLQDSICRLGLPAQLAYPFADASTGITEAASARPVLLPQPIEHEGVLQLNGLRAYHWLLVDALGRVLHSDATNNARQIVIRSQGHAPGLYSIVLLAAGEVVGTVRCMFGPSAGARE